MDLPEFKFLVQCVRCGRQALSYLSVSLPRRRVPLATDKDNNGGPAPNRAPYQPLSAALALSLGTAPGASSGGTHPTVLEGASGQASTR